MSICILSVDYLPIHLLSPTQSLLHRSLSRRLWLTIAFVSAYEDGLLFEERLLEILVDWEGEIIDYLALFFRLHTHVENSWNVVSLLVSRIWFIIDIIYLNFRHFSFTFRRFSFFNTQLVSQWSWTFFVVHNFDHLLIYRFLLATCMLSLLCIVNTLLNLIWIDLLAPLLSKHWAIASLLFHLPFFLSLQLIATSLTKSFIFLCLKHATQSYRLRVIVILSRCCHVFVVFVGAEVRLRHRRLVGPRIFLLRWNGQR